MSDGSATSPAPAPAPAPPPRAGRRLVVARWGRRLLALVTALLAASIVTLLSVDIGSFGLRQLAEREGSKFFERPLRIGAIRALLTPGYFALEDLVIEGRTPEARPFLAADRIVVRLDWTALIRRELIFEVEMTGWAMVIETGPDGHNLPRFGRRREPSGAPPTLKVQANFVYADRGHFTFIDHGLPWSVTAPNLSVDIVRAANLDQYLGTARFHGGTIAIQQYRPMQGSFDASFTFDGPRVLLHRIEILTDGARTDVTGSVDFPKWPEQRYQVRSRLDFPTMRDIFFAGEDFTVAGAGDFTGEFHLFKGGHSLTGDFASAEAGVNDLRFPRLRGAIRWDRDGFAVTRAESDFYGGRATFTYGLRVVDGPDAASFTAAYEGVDLARIGPVLGLDTLDLAGRASGDVAMAWPNGRFSQGLDGRGETRVAPPEGVALAPRELPAAAPAVPGPVPDAPPFDPDEPPGTLAVGGAMSYRFGPEWIEFDPGSWAATPTTWVAFRGRTAYGDRSDIPFEVTSLDWQASDRLLAAIMTEAGAPTRAVEVGGRGRFTGVLTDSFGDPRIAGRFTGDGMRAWDVTWGRVAGDLVVQNAYVDINDAVIGGAEARIRATGRFSLGYPRRDGGEEINARFRVEDWPLSDFRRAFDLEDWPVDGVATAELTLRGRYEGPYGAGQLRIDRGVAWDETFETAVGALSFEGTGLSIQRIQMTKAPGAIRGAAWIGWDGTYSFDAAGERLLVETLANFRLEGAPLSGVLRFTTSGAGSFDAPAYEFEGTVADLFAGDEGIGQVTGKLTIRNDVMTIEVVAADARLQVQGSGSIALNDQLDAEMTFRFLNSSIDPYLRFVAPGMSPYTRAVASGSVRVAGELNDLSRLLVDVTVDSLALTLFDYALRNDGPIRLTFEDHAARVGRFRLTGQDTELDLTGGVDVGRSRLELTATGHVNLAVLQLIQTGVTSRGAVAVRARVTGELDAPTYSGEAVVSNGRLRHLAMPHSLTAINGPIRVDASGIHLDELTAEMGGGRVTFGGRVTLAGYLPDEFAVTAAGRAMRLRIPEGFQSTVNADLTLTGPVDAPTLGGTVDVLRSTYAGEVETDALLGMAAAAGGGGGPGGAGVPAEPGYPLAFDIRIRADRTLVIEKRDAQIEGSADLWVLGTLDRPVFTGRIDINRGEVFFSGNRYVVRRGVIDFSNPARLEPVFDIEAETRPRAPGQTFAVTVRLTGTFDKLVPTLTSDPWLPDLEILALLFGETPDPGTAEQRALRSPQESQAQLLRTAMTQVLVSPISSRVGNVFERTIPVDTVQITPLLGSETALQQLNPTARLTFGKRLSSRVFLTYSRALNASQYEIILLEYDQSDRISWVLSRNEDRTFALDFRIRHVF